MKPSNKLLIERGVWHSSTSTGSAIFGEASATHTKDESYHEDEAITSLVPILRKTILKTW